MKKIVLSIIILSLLAFGIHQLYFKKAENEFTLAEVSRGAIYQEVLETGTVKKGEEIALSFKSSGRIEKIYVEVGDIIKDGALLAKLEATELQIQLKEAEANSNLVKIKLDKLLAGARQKRNFCWLFSTQRNFFRNESRNSNYSQRKTV